MEFKIEAQFKKERKRVAVDTRNGEFFHRDESKLLTVPVCKEHKNTRNPMNTVYNNSKEKNTLRGAE